MSFLRPRSMLRSVALRPAALSAAPRARLQVRFATADYGSPDGNPAAEKGQTQGQNASENLEHPGPPPPKVAEGKSSSSPDSDDKSSGGGGDNSSPKKSSSSSSSKGSSSGKREFSTSTRRWAVEEPAVKEAKANKPSKSDMKKAQPKILNENPPTKGEETEDVKKHNEEMDNRAEQAHEKVPNEDASKDKVPSEFWKG